MRIGSELVFFKNSIHFQPMTYGGFGPSTEETKRMIEKMDAWTKKIAAKPGAAKRFLIKHGFITRTGKLTKRYGG